MDDPELFRDAGQCEGAYAPRGRRLRVLVVAHSHPKLSNGGAEISAWQLYQCVAGHDATEAWFLGCDRQRVLARAGAVITQPFGAREYLYSPGEFDWFRFANRDISFPDAFQALLEELLPDVVHFHHYAVLGLEAFAHVKRAVPAARIVLTLHEYLAICNHYGQMVTRPGRALCYEASPLACTRCFSDKDASEWFLRKRYIEHFFRAVDHFVAPSQFLADRYIHWGVPEAKISVIENLVRPQEGQRRKPPQPPTPLRIGFFGQLSWLKGCHVLLDAAELLQEQQKHIVFDIFGDYRSQPEEFQKEFLDRLAGAGRNVRFHGPYDQRQLDPLMQLVHAVVVPSVWWENSPLVIQEAFRNNRPVICSDIGGMREKVRDGIDGLHFPAGDAVALAALLADVVENPGRLTELSAGMQKPPAAEVILDSHLGLYRRLRAQSGPHDWIS